MVRENGNSKSSPGCVMYSSDGFGRDTYINFNNGGYWKDKLQAVSTVDKFDVPKHRKNVAPFSYYSDGSGRDSYVVHESGGLKHNFKSMSSFSLLDFVRNSEKSKFNENINPKTLYISKQEQTQNIQSMKLGKQVTNRLYYEEKYKFRPGQDKRIKSHKEMLRNYDTSLPVIKNSLTNKKNNYLVKNTE